jgi:large subunit ribosomal protein L25
VATKEHTLSIESRAKVGTTGSNALRHAGKIPVVVYGHGAAPEHVAIDAHAFEELLHHGGRNAIITLTDAAKKGETAMIRAVQYHPISRRVLHADLQRVSAKESIAASLAVITLGVARGIKDFGGVMDVVTHELEIEGPADSIPENIEVDVTELGLHEHVTAGDIKLPSGFKMLTPPDTIVVAIEPSRTERELEEAAAGPVEGAEPEVIGATTPPEPEPG